ncbi:MAG TPA: DUF455 family protein [Thermoanaerobaculia bacterium]|nr:DUF455 family protein [Thermoanaerobaculia bacterium]
MTTHAPPLAPNPARDPRFEVRDFWRDMTNLPPDHPEHRNEFLHRQLNEEVNSIEIASRNLADFPDAPWELRMQIARQCADECRHVEAFRRLLEARGGYVGQYPVLNFQFRIIIALESLIGRLAVANRSFEAGGLDAIQDGIDASEGEEEDPDFLRLFDAQLADEMQHVRFANVWIRKLVELEGPRAVMALARDVARADDAYKHVVGDAGFSYNVATDLRREAGFSDEEIEAARVLAERR